MRLSDLNTSMLDDIRGVLDFPYVVRSDRDDRREYVVSPKLSWDDDGITITDGFGFSHAYDRGNINIGSNSLFVYSTDGVVQDMYVGYEVLSPGERVNYDRFLSVRRVQADLATDVDLTHLPASIAFMVREFVGQVRSADLLGEDLHDVTVGGEDMTLTIDLGTGVYRLYDWEDDPGEDDPALVAYSLAGLVYGIVGMLSDRYRFKVDPRVRRDVMGVTDLARVYDPMVMETVEPD